VNTLIDPLSECGHDLIPFFAFKTYFSRVLPLVFHAEFRRKIGCSEIPQHPILSTKIFFQSQNTEKPRKMDLDELLIGLEQAAIVIMVRTPRSNPPDARESQRPAHKTLVAMHFAPGLFSSFCAKTKNFPVGFVSFSRFSRSRPPPQPCRTSPVTSPNKYS
jgi:hypothetical protein